MGQSPLAYDRQTSRMADLPRDEASGRMNCLICRRPGSGASLCAPPGCHL